ncbi:hypothetical protein A33M_1901 [Rhodovulum sp. PH10]|uniref:helix-turn-helix domain-containing protein n=1 Tax=Rhodovulum sp. PH10 TaxID=1187851 RepID=UPI00027C28D5|nr:helix-turn-helix domain-containing protein [Rhodovulum sp. PH10]EJW12618.1 hypothetical protein A33M_1901 [Rhodovulum sp. PH10]
MANEQSIKAPTIAELSARLAALQSGYDALAAEVVELRARLDVPETSRSHLVPIKDAARRTGHSVDTLKRWCDQHEIGHKVGGRWKVDMLRYAAFRDGRIYRGIADE